DKRALLETVARNAAEALTHHKLRRAGDLTTRSQALEEIAEALGRDSAPLRIECYDVSQIHGTDVVASMVVFEDGLPRKSEYRRFTVRADRADDLTALSEVLRRRFSRYLEARAATGEIGEETSADPDRPGIDPATGKPRKFAYPPQLVVVDGGLPQVNAAAKVLSELSITEVAVCGLAKRLEEVWLPGQRYPVILPRQSQSLYLLQRIRDEAHRFAITYHRQRRSKRMVASGLDAVPGLGEVRRKALLRRFGSVKRLSAATAEEIAQVPGIGPRTAEAIVAALSGRSAAEGGAPTAEGRPPASKGGPSAPATDGGAAAVDAAVGRSCPGGAGPGQIGDVPDSSPGCRARGTRAVACRWAGAPGGGVTGDARGGGVTGEPTAGHGPEVPDAAADTEAPDGTDTELVVATGVSGGGRSTSARALDNVGFYVVDNLPEALLPQMAELAQRAGAAARRTAMVLDV